MALGGGNVPGEAGGGCNPGGGVTGTHGAEAGSQELPTLQGKGRSSAWGGFNPCWVPSKWCDRRHQCPHLPNGDDDPSTPRRVLTGIQKRLESCQNFLRTL